MTKQRMRSLIKNLGAFLAGFFGGGFVHWYLMYLLDTQTVLRDYSWSDPVQGGVERLVLFGDFAIGAVLIIVIVTLIIVRGFNTWRSFLVGLGASIAAYTLSGIVLCMMGC